MWVFILRLWFKFIFFVIFYCLVVGVYGRVFKRVVGFCKLVLFMLVGLRWGFVLYIKIGVCMCVCVLFMGYMCIWYIF